MTESQIKTVLITGGAGFFGEVLKKRLLEDGFRCVSIDLEKDHFCHPNLESIQGDVRDVELMEHILCKHKFDAIFHCAAILAHAIKDKDFLWTSNVEGTRNMAKLAKKYKVHKIIFTSSNCLWAKSFSRPVVEEDLPNPAEIYGKSKLEAERILLQYVDCFDVIIFRCPTIISSGRLGLLAILFEFIREGRKVWIVGDGNNRYQFICAQDLANACMQALVYDGSDIFNIGSDNVKSLREVYSYVIERANTGAKVASLPKRFTILLMKIAHILKISPLGPYQYKMIAEDFIFDTSKIKLKLNWKPTLTNEDMLYNAYLYYNQNLDTIRKRTNVSAHKQPAKMGVIKLLKWLS
jgi:nucleoside-diphosphate-sugar epimerase